MKLRNPLAILGVALLSAGISRASIPYENNYQGTGIVYAQNGVSTVGITPPRFLVVNASAVPLLPVAATRTYIVGTSIPVPPTGLLVGSTFQWTFDMTKTGAGTATSTIDIAFGTTATTTDTAQVAFTKPAGVANADECQVTVTCVVKAVNATTGVVTGEILVEDNQTGAGGHLAAGKYIFAQNVTSGSFNNIYGTTSLLYVGLCITTGASDAITINWATAQATAI